MDDVQLLSDYKEGAFGRPVGLLVESSRLLARPITLVDQHRMVRYIQIVPDSSHLTDRKKAWAKATARPFLPESRRGQYVDIEQKTHQAAMSSSTKDVFPDKNPLVACIGRRIGARPQGLSMNIENKVASEMAPIFLELGKALLICQSLEVSLRALNARLSRDEADGEETAFGASLDFYSNETLGQSINNLRKRIDIPADLSDYLESGLKIRNEIVHDSMTKNMQRFAHPQGRLEVESELAFMKNEVKKRNVLVNKLLNALSAKDELSQAGLKRNDAQLWAFMNAVAGPAQ